jgi:hypothetical protein
MPFRGTGDGPNPPRANLQRDELHDVVQFAGRELPDNLPDPRHPAGRRRHHWRQRQSKHGLSAQLHDATDELPDHLRANLAVAVSAADRRSAQVGDGFGDRLDRFFGRGAADRNGFSGAVEIEPADMTDARGNMNVRRIAGEPHPGETVLHDVE